MICPDTSFLISLYGTDVNTPAALQLIARVRDRLVIHPIVEFEFANALRHLVYRGKITTAGRLAWQGNLEADLAAGIAASVPINANAVLQIAFSLSSKWSETGGYRGFDILIIAAAKLVGATHFWSFDDRQRRLAAAEGLIGSP